MVRLRRDTGLYETRKERGATILIPRLLVDSKNPVVTLAVAG
jgi:hypothetical protein